MIIRFSLVELRHLRNAQRNLRILRWAGKPKIVRTHSKIKQNYFWHKQWSLRSFASKKLIGIKLNARAAKSSALRKAIKS